ncbi:neuraminidase-like domain-containing protein [Morganella morganii]|uniref:Tc toxin subunit A-related protein n=1 Tax=Morganella morganii TaxID=582 RepID=UPI0034E56F3A
MQILVAMLKKISDKGDNTEQTLCDLMPLSYAEIYEKYHDVISDDEARTLFQQAQRQKKKNRFTDAKIVTHNNPQIKNIPHLYTGQSPERCYGNDFIPDRISEYAEPGMVSSMFSPAAYLTELYREARALHKQDSKYHLDKRRPDLKALSLSQENLDDEISTLELSNDVLFTALKGNGDEQSVLQRLSEKYQSINLPYHEPFQIIKKVSALKNIFPVVNKYPVIINNKKTDKTWIKTTNCNLSPSLLDMLKEIYTNINSSQGGKPDELIKKYITDDLPYLYFLKNVMNYFDLTSKEFSILTEFFKMKSDANQGNIAEYKKNILKLRGVVSLYKTSELPLETIVFILNSFKCDLADEKAINAIINLKIVRDNYQLRDEDIAVLLGGGIVKDKVNTDISQFDRIFNNPPLGGSVFKDDNTEINFFTGNYPDNSHERFIINCLKRSLGVNESGLAGLCEFIYGEKSWVKCNIEFLSLCYRTVLISRVNHISANELIILFRLLPDVFKNNIQTYKTSDDIYDMLYNVNYYTTWFNENKLSISMCYFLLHKSDEVVVTQGINDIISEIRNGLNEEDFNDELSNTIELIKKISPALSSVLDISSVNAMKSVLQWVNKLKPDGIDIKTLFSNICDKKKNPDQKDNKTIIYIIKISVMINMIATDDSLLSSWVKTPALLDKSLSQLKYDFTTIKMMADANSAIRCTGEKSDLIISELNDGKLSYKMIADVFNQNEKVVQQVFKYLDKTGNITDYRSLTDVAMVLDSFTETEISPDDFTKLFGSNAENKDYIYYYNLSKIAESTLEQDKIADLKGTVNNLRSPVLCSLYVSEKLSDLKHDNNSVAVYKYLLIDTEISEEIKTTRIAEAISCIQLYVNHCLNNLEEEVQDSVRTHSFFRDWETYNRRYSTWAALSMLVYYPENYIDPVIRAGKTAMMDNLQQRISQEGIKKEAIDDAFRTYLTEFDQVADLNVISAYHDEIDIKKGKTYLIGHSGLSAGSYYIRRINHENINIKEKIEVPSFAWSDWCKIECGMNPYKNIIRPVIFNSRLYIFWLEYSRVEIKDESAQGKISLMFSYLRYDNTWSEVGFIDLSERRDKLINLGLHDNKNKKIGLYCSENISGYGLLFAFYDIKSDSQITDAVMFYFQNENSVNDVPADKKDKISDVIKGYFDSNDVKKVISIHSADNVSIVRKSSDDVINNIKGGSDIVSVSMKTTGLSLSSDGKKYTGKFKLKFLMKKPPLSFGDDRDSQYAAYLDVCNIALWHDHNIEHSIAYLNTKIKVDNEHVIDSVVFIFDRTTNSYILFLYDSSRRERVITDGSYFSEINMIFGSRDGEREGPNIQEIQSDVVIKSGAGDIIDFISLPGGYVYLKLKFQSFGYQTKSAVLVKKFFNNEPALTSLTAQLSVGDEIKSTLRLEQWCEEKKSIDNDGIQYTSKDNVFSFDIKKSELINCKNNKVCIYLVASDRDGVMITYKIMNELFVFDGNKNVINIKDNKRGAQYLEFCKDNDSDCKKTRIRLNTLFVRDLVLLANKGVGHVLSWRGQNLTEPDIDDDDDFISVPIDFNGANALYFWELFYYAPMMITDILLQHQSYNEAERWLHYIFNPAGYIENDIYTDRYWNVRPLAEDTQWNESLPDDTDPDAIALADPMHYKIATLMKTLELIIARGDAAYRELERDSLNEAKSWYMQALSLLGKEPVTLLNKNWSSPVLEDAANMTVQSTIQHLLMQINTPGDSSAISVNSANTLINVFKPQLNEKLIACRDTINQRLFNLRNGLSINGQRLYLPIFSSPTDPRNMLESQVNTINSEKTLKNKKMLMYRFPEVIENAKSLVAQLIEFGDKLLSFNESRDNEKFSELLIHQGDDLLSQSIRIQDAEIKSLQSEKILLLSQQREIIHRAEHYETLYSEYILPGEAGAIVLNTLAAGLSGQSRVIKGLGMLADLAPNIFGVAAGGSDWSAGTDCASELMGGAAETMQGLAYPLEKGAEYRRRAQEWQLEAESAREEEKQIAAELEAMDMQITAANMQKDYITTEQRQNQQQLQFLQRKFTRTELYGWLRGRLMAIYSPFYDLAVSRCFMAEDAYRYEMNINAEDRSFINTSAWKGAYSGLMAGESLMLNLAQLEEAYLEKDKRVLEVTRTVSLAEVYNSEIMGNNKFSFADVTALVSDGKPNKRGSDDNYVALVSTAEQTNSMELDAVIKLDELGIYTDYPTDLGEHRLIMQISVTLPALIEPYQNVRALLEYITKSDEEVLPEGCSAIAVSHGMNDSGLFHLQFGDSTYLPFEGLSVKGKGHFKLRFFDVGGGDQKRLLQTLTDIVLHIRYTIY